ncbi:MAG: hypothetical protein J1F71_05535 [Clostridiales bacterium]|nr:hypothetical protein [Clostridiales bacterium]
MNFSLKKSKRIIILLSAIVAALFLTGCGATLSVYEYTEGGVRFQLYELSIDEDTVAAMESTATADEDGNKYTVEGYFARLFDDYGYSLVAASRTGGKYTVRYRKPVGVGDLDDVGTAVNFTTTHTENPFVRTYTAVAQNPFNGVREAYDNVLPLQSATVIERLKNGVVAHDQNGEVVVSFPSIENAFPYLKGLNPDGLLLNYVRYGSDRMESSGRKVKSGETTAYVFSRYFDDTEAYISYTYKRAVPYGWYITAIAAGALALGAILLITRKKKDPLEESVSPEENTNDITPEENTDNIELAEQPATEEDAIEQSDEEVKEKTDA